MANWRHTVNISKEWQAVKDKTMEVWELTDVLSEHLKRINTNATDDVDWVLEDIIDELSDFAKDKITDVDAFDAIMHQVYDWADTPLSDRWPCDRKCWIQT